jgi:hypothetical protein
MIKYLAIGIMIIGIIFVIYGYVTLFSLPPPSPVETLSVGLGLIAIALGLIAIWISVKKKD